MLLFNDEQKVVAEGYPYPRVGGYDLPENGFTLVHDLRTET